MPSFAIQKIKMVCSDYGSVQEDEIKDLLDMSYKKQT